MAWSADKVRKYRGNSTETAPTQAGGGWTADKIRAIRQPVEEKKPVTFREEDDSSLLPSVQERAAAARSKAGARVEKKPEPKQNLAMMNRVEPGDVPQRKAPSLTSIQSDMANTAQKQSGKLGVGKTLGYGAAMGINEADAGLAKITKDLYNVSAAPVRPWNVAVGGKKVNVNPINQASNVVQKYVGKPLRDLVRKQEWLPSWMKPADESLFDGSRDPIAEGLQGGQDYFSDEGMKYQRALEGGTALENTVGRATAEITKMVPQMALALMSGGATAPGMVSGNTAMAAQAALRPGVAGLSGATLYEAGKDLSMMAPFGVQALGGYLRDAESKGATPAQQWASALPSASLEVVTEMIPFGFFKKTLGVSDDLVQAASKAGAKKAQRYFGELAKAEVFNAATQIVQEIGINPFTAAIEKAVYNPDMAWTGENGVFDAKETWETAKVTGVMSLMMAALGLPFSAPGHARALRMLQQPESVTSEDVSLLQEEVRSGITQEADPLQNIAKQMADQVMPETAQAEQAIQQEETQTVQREQADKEQRRAVIESIAEPVQQEEQSAMPSTLSQEQADQAETTTDTPAPVEAKTEAVRAPENITTQKPKAPAPQSEVGRTGRSVLKKWSQNEVFGVDEKGPDHPFTTGFKKLYEAGQKSVEMEGDPSKNRFRLMQEVERGYTQEEQGYMKPWFQDTAYNAGRDDAMTAKPKKTENPAAAVEVKPEAPATEESAHPRFSNDVVKPFPGRLYREVGNARRIESYFDKSQSDTAYGVTSDIYVAKSPEMALGQGDNKGIMLEFDGTDVPLQQVTKPIGEVDEYIVDDGRTDLHRRQEAIRDKLVRFTVSKELASPLSQEDYNKGKQYYIDKARIRKFILGEDGGSNYASLQKNWTRINNADGSVTFEKNGIESPAQETAQTEEPTPAAEPVSPTEEKLAKLDEKLDRLIEAVGGKLEVEGSVTNGSKSEPVSGGQLEVESGGGSAVEGSGAVQRAERKQSTEQPGGDNGTAGDDSVRSGGNIDAAESGSGTEQRPVGAPGADSRTGSRKPRTSQPAIRSRNYRIKPGDVLFEGGKKTRFKNNVAAIQLMKQIEAEGRIATPAEQQTLLKYVGWGGLADAFDRRWDGANRAYVPGKSEWAKEFNELAALLTKEEYEAARQSTQNAHYTHPDIINVMYTMAKKLGFKGGTVLEPSAGTGHFIGLLPEEFMSSRVLAVEKDSLTGRIAKLLYPDADVRVSGFENVDIPNNYFDLAISNVPFGDITIYDKSYKAGYITSRIHNYFFVKALDKVKPGGAVMFITSAGTMNASDSVGNDIRRHIAANADLVAAFRLPGDAFKENAGTEVTTDIIILRKRIPGEIPHGPAFQNVVDVQMNNKTMFNNEYFVEHPENVLGKLVEDKLWGGRLAVANDGRFEERLEEAVKSLPSGVFNPVRGTIETLTPEQEANIMQSVKNNSYFLRDGILHQKLGDKAIKVDGGPIEKMATLVGIKDAAKEVLAAQLRDASDTELSALQKKLSKQYDAFVKKYGHITEKANAKVLRADPENYLLNSLEVYNKKTDTVEKAGIFSKRIVQRYKKPESANTPDEAIAISLYETGRLDLSRVADLLNLSDEEAETSLNGFAYKNPAGTWETPDEYLSGNVRQKLAEAREAAKLDKRYNANVEALERVQPEDIKAADIDVKIGASWLPPAAMQGFIADLLETNPRNISTAYNKVAGSWSISAEPSAKRSYQNTTKWGAEGWGALDLIDTVSNMKQPVYTYEDAEGRKVIDQEKTAALKAKADEIKEAFADWVWKDAGRRAALEAVYNDTFNAIRNREYAGVDRSYPGMSEIVKLRKHQREGVERIIYGGNTMLAHGVGFGKTYLMLAGAMELKRLGIANKPMFVVPNDKLSDFQNDLKVMYPNAKVLAAAEDDFNPQNIRSLFAKIATNDWDVVIVRHDSFTKIPTSQATQQAYIQEQIQEVEQAIIEAAAEKNTNITKQLEKAKQNLEVKLQALAEMKKIDLLTFEEMGIDYLFVDEAHEFKNLRTFTKLSNVKGINTRGGPTTEDFYSKVRYVSQLHGGKRGLVFATGTPISNTLNELYTLFKYLRPDILRDAGVGHFDAWMSAFGNIENRTEIKHDGRFKPVDRFRSFVNVEELMAMFKEFADIRMDKDDVDLAVPELDGGKPIVNESTPHPMFKAFSKKIIDRMNNLPRRPAKGEDNALSIAGDARRATTDMRLIDPSYGDHKDSKINRAVQNVIEIYKSTGDRKATQMVFLGEGRSYDKDRTDPTGKKKTVRFDAYNDIRLKLVKAGIPASEVVFAESYKTKEQKEQLYKDMNSGKIRVIIGSYALMGTGLNIQERLYSIHEIDVPWRPSDIEQSEGRMVRQGNMHTDWKIPVKIHRYIVAGEGSFDAFMWQLQESKLVGQQKFYKGGIRKVEVEEDPNVEMVRAMKAQATGNPLVMKKVELEAKLVGLRGQKKSHNRAAMESEDRIAKIPAEIGGNERYVAAMEKDLSLRDVPPSEAFTIKIGSKKYTDKAKAAEALSSALAVAAATMDMGPIGEYAGFKLVPAIVTGAKHGAVSVEGNAKYSVTFSSDGEGMFTSLNNTLNGIERRIEDAKTRVQTLTKEMADRKADMGKPFAKETELREVATELQQVNAEMERQYKENDTGFDAEEEDDVPDEFKGETPATLDLSSEGGYIRLPGGRPSRNDTGMYRFADEELEAQHESAKLTPANILDKVKAWGEDFALASTRTFKAVDPTVAKNSEFISAMVKYPKLKTLAGGRAIRIINDILKREGVVLSNDEYNLFNRYILLRDLKEEVKAEHPLPGKWTPAAVEAYLAEVESLLNDNTREAVKRRDGYIKKIKDEYIAAMDALGWNVKSRFKRENYFRHQVLEYAQAKITGGGKRINVKRSRGWLKQRHGSTMLINEDYLQAEYEVMASMIHDAEVAKMLKDIGDKYDIKASLKRKAKAIDQAKLQELYDADIASGNVVKRTVGKGDAAMEIERSVTEDTLMNFNRKMAIAFGRLSKAASNGALWDGDGEWSDVVMSLAMDDRAEDTSSRVFRYLAELADQNDDTGITARTILKAISDKKKAVEALIGKKTEWNDIIPDGYVEFQPIIGKHFYAANAVTENLANALLTGNLKEIGLSDMKVQKIMTMGSPFNSFVIPAEYVTTMEDVYGDIKNGAIDNMVAAFMKGWKIWNLHLNPWRFVKYNLRNATGDFERLLGAAGVRGVNPVYAKRAAKELFDAMRYNKFTKELVEFREMGGMQDNLYVQEIAAINDAKIFQEFSSKKRTVMDKILFVPKTWDEFSSNTTEYRENILRYAAYLYYRQDLTATGGKPTFYGASLRARIDGLSSVEEKAYQLSKDAIGAYDEVSETGRWIRRYLIPFWSFQETNLKYYKRLVENTIKDDTVTEAFGKHAARSLGITVKLSAKALRKIGTIAMRVAFFSLALLLWNRLAMGDEDDDLDEDIRNNPHITLGRLPNGDVLYFSRLGTLSDLLEWFNLNSVPNEIADIAEDRSSFAHLAEEMAKGPVNKLVNGMAPYLKIPAELLSGKQFYPDAFRPRNIRDLGKYAADQAGVGKEYDRLTGKPVKESYAKAWMDSVIYRSDPEQTAYYSVLDLKDKYRKNVLGKSSGTGFNNDAKSKALYYYKLSLKYGDKPKADKYLQEYYANGGTSRGLNQSLATLEPLYSLNEAERGGFYEWLRPNERVALEKAYRYYNETLGGGQ